MKNENLADIDESHLKASFVAEVRAAFKMLDSEHEGVVHFGKVLRALKHCKLRPRASIKSVKHLQFCPHETKLPWTDFLRVYYVAKNVFDAKAREEALEWSVDNDYYSFHDYFMEFASSELRKTALSDINRGINRFSDLFGAYYMRPFTPPSQLRDMLFMERETRLSDANVDEDSLPLISYPGRSLKPGSSPGTYRLKADSSAQNARIKARTYL